MSFLRHCPSFLFYKKNSHSSLELPLCSRLIGQRAPGIHGLYIPSVRIASTHHTQLFLFVFMDSGYGTQTILAARQGLY